MMGKQLHDSYSQEEQGPIPWGVKDILREAGEILYGVGLAYAVAAENMVRGVMEVGKRVWEEGCGLPGRGRGKVEIPLNAPKSTPLSPQLD